MEKIKELYNTLYESPNVLTNEQLGILVKDFTERNTGKISQNNSGKYRIKRSCSDYIFNGYLITSPDEHKIKQFKVFVDQPEEIVVEDMQEVTLVNCDCEKIEVIYSLTSKENDVEDAIEKLERLSKLYSSGAITDVEYQKLKKLIVK